MIILNFAGFYFEFTSEVQISGILDCSSPFSENLALDSCFNDLSIEISFNNFNTEFLNPIQLFYNAKSSKFPIKYDLKSRKVRNPLLIPIIITLIVSIEKNYNYAI